MNDDQLQISTTTDGQPPREGYEQAAAPAPINPHSGQHEAYWVLSPEERAKGFVRPVRLSYRHVGTAPRYPLRDLTEEEHTQYARFGYVKFEAYPESESPLTGKFWTQAELDRRRGCGVVTTMSRAIAETYARDPRYYGSTFCAGCGIHLPVGEHGEFVWADDSEEKVGT